MLRRARESIRGRHPFLFWNNYVKLPGSDRTLSDLEAVNFKYERMLQTHEELHAGLIASLDAERNRTVLEIACGAGFAIPHFRAKNLDYFGWDISETALAVAMLKYPEASYFNLSVVDLKLVKDASFDIVYSSSMLEHIGFWEQAIREMVRVAKNNVYIMFFQGLFAGDENKSEFLRYEEEVVAGSKGHVYGRKLILQDHMVHNEKGWFVHKFSRNVVTTFVRELGYEFEILDGSNTDYIDNEAVLVIRKNRP